MQKPRVLLPLRSRCRQRPSASAAPPSLTPLRGRHRHRRCTKPPLWLALPRMLQVCIEAHVHCLLLVVLCFYRWFPLLLPPAPPYDTLVSPLASPMARAGVGTGLSSGLGSGAGTGTGAGAGAGTGTGTGTGTGGGLSAGPATSDRSEEDSDLALIGSLNELFREIDTVGDGVASWEQFSRFVIEKAAIRRDGFSVDAVAEYSRQKLQPLPKSRKDPNAMPMSDTAIPERVLFLPSIDCMAVSEARSPVRGTVWIGPSPSRSDRFDSVGRVCVILSFCHSVYLSIFVCVCLREQVVKIVDAQNLWAVGELNAGAKGHKGSIEALAYCEPRGVMRRDSGKGPSYLISSGSDSTIALWTLAPGIRQFSMVHRFSTPYAQPSLCYSPTYNVLYSGSAVGMVHTWDLKHGFETSCMPGHTDMVLDMLHIPDIEQLATCSLDRTVRVWDMVSGSQVRRPPVQFVCLHLVQALTCRCSMCAFVCWFVCLQRMVLHGHNKGVVGLAYVPDYNFLLSASYDHEAIIWSPLVPSMLYKLKGHTAPLVGVRAGAFVGSAAACPSALRRCIPAPLFSGFRTGVLTPCCFGSPVVFCAAQCQALQKLSPHPLTAR